MSTHRPSYLNQTAIPIQADAELDLRGVICPYNFVKTKLKLETMERGQILSVLLDDGDPIRNVPQSVRATGLPGDPHRSPGALSLILGQLASAFLM